MSISERELRARIHMRAHVAQVISSKHKKQLNSTAGDLSEDQISSLSKTYASEAPSHLHEALGEATIIRAFEKEFKKLLKGNRLAQQAKKIPEFVFKLGGAIAYRGDEDGLVLKLNTLRDERDKISDRIDDINFKIYEVEDPMSDSRVPIYLRQDAERRALLDERYDLQVQYDEKRDEIRELIKIRRELGAQYGLIIKKEVTKSILHGKSMVDSTHQAVKKSAKRKIKEFTGKSHYDGSENNRAKRRKKH